MNMSSDYEHPLKGKKQSIEHVEKRRLILKKMFQEGKLKIPDNKGRKLTEEHRKKLSESKRGSRPWRVGVPIESNQHEKHFKWKGDNASYSAVHKWVRRHKGRPIDCKNCDKYSKRYEWASISHGCERDLDDYINLCTSCHRLYDNGKIKLPV